MRTILMHGVAPQCAIKGTRPSLGGEAGGRSPGFISLRPTGSQKPSPLPRLRCQLSVEHGVPDVAVAPGRAGARRCRGRRW